MGFNRAASFLNPQKPDFGPYLGLARPLGVLDEFGDQLLHKHNYDLHEFLKMVRSHEKFRMLGLSEPLQIFSHTDP